MAYASPKTIALLGPFPIIAGDENKADQLYSFTASRVQTTSSFNPSTRKDLSTNKY